MKPSALLIASALCTLSLGAARAEIQTSGLFSDHMVLQRDAPVKVWGWATEPGERVAVALAQQRKEATARKEDGLWMVVLDPMRAGGPHTLTIQGANQLVINDVIIGDVWLCAGQSNMEFPLRAANNAEQEIANAELPNLRVFRVPRAMAATPQRRLGGAWQTMSPRVAPTTSAVAYFFGRELYQSENVPVGLIEAGWAAAYAENWVSSTVLGKDPKLSPSFMQLRFHSMAAGIAGLDSRIHGHLMLGRDLPEGKFVPGGAYNAMIAALVSYAIRGVAWYQGESNAWLAHQHQRLLPALIRDWRAAWGQGDFPFLVVQLANFHGEPDWAELREAQRQALELPRTALVVTIDIGEPENVHPKDKRTVGHRLALAARAVAYGRDIIHSGPALESMAIEGEKVRLRFQHVGRGLTTPDGRPPTGFIVAGADRKFHPATAAIEGGTMVVQSLRVPRPVAVRYAWANNPKASLYNAPGLPASPFRTDDWPMVTSRDLSEVHLDPGVQREVIDYYLHHNLFAQAGDALGVIRDEELRMSTLSRIVARAAAAGLSVEARAILERQARLAERIDDQARKAQALATIQMLQKILRR